MLNILTYNSSSITCYADPHNSRIRIDDYAGNPREILQLINNAVEEWAEKIIVKSRKAELIFFLDNGFKQEAFVKHYFKGDDMHFLSKYSKQDRASSSKFEMEEQLLREVTSSVISNKNIGTCEVEIAQEADADELTTLYAHVFRIYPTPISNPGYVLKSMQAGTIYVVIKEESKIVSAASAEINQQYQNAELTDCATLPHVQGKGHMKKLLCRLEKKLLSMDIKCVYTIARAESHSMNKVFHQLRYSYGGRMINNCHIYSGLEDMNVWYKNL